MLMKSAITVLIRMYKNFIPEMNMVRMTDSTIKIVLVCCVFCAIFCMAVAFKLSGDNVIMEQRIAALERDIYEMKAITDYRLDNGSDGNFAQKR